MKVEIVSTQTIRPAESPSPVAAEKCFTLSIFDQLSPDMDIPVILFYSATGDEISVEEASNILKKSLSETLSHYFPLTGRITNNVRIDNEGPGAGIEYTEARVRCELRDILSPPNMESIVQLIPARVNLTDNRPLLVVRQSVFDCGGMAIGICFLHKVVDATAVCWFLRSWSSTARAGGSHMAAAPYLSSASRFPPLEALATAPSPFPEPNKVTSSRRFVLSGSQVASLKARSCSQSVPNPTRVAAVMSLIWQCAMRLIVLLRLTR